MKKSSLLLLTSFIAVVTFLLLPSCIPNTPGGNPQPQCYRYDIVYDSLQGTYDTIRVVVPCNNDTITPPIDTAQVHCDTVFVDTTYIQPIYVWSCDSSQQNTNDTTNCRYIFSHNETITETFPRVTCR